jgi:hypothetical protein
MLFNLNGFFGPVACLAAFGIRTGILIKSFLHLGPGLPFEVMAELNLKLLPLRVQFETISLVVPLLEVIEVGLETQK